MPINRVVEYAFFFLLLAGAGYLAWKVLSPFLAALALSIIIVTICYPLYEKVRAQIYKRNQSLAAAISTLIVVIIVVLPLILISSVLVKEIASFYNTLSTGQELALEVYLLNIESTLQSYIPGFELNLTEQVRQSTEWLVRNIGAIFAGTLSTLFIIFISLIGSFYFFRDGKEFLKTIIRVNPLPNADGEVIFSRLGKAIRSVATGVLLLSLIQGIVAASGLAIFGINRAVLWGAVGAILAMIPGIGTIAIMIPAIIYLFLVGATTSAVGLIIWTIITIIVVDNMLGPYLMSRGNKLHPFLMLTSVLGGISTFGPIGFIIGPVIITLFIVLLEVYNQYMIKDRIRLNK